jgi:Uma2 family endonuclease
MATNVALEDIGAFLERLVREGRIKLEITAGTRTWRLMPSPRHQKVIDRIRATISPTPETSGGCPCYHLSDVQLKFPDGSFKRPDIAIFCVEPPDIDESWEQVPEAVIEVVSPDYEEKDLSINPTWYLSQGVRDVLVIEPRSGQITHAAHGQTTQTLSSPTLVALQCGCQVWV